MTIEDYILAQEEALQPVLRDVCGTIRAAVGEAEERISWQMPTWRRGHNLIHFAAQKRHECPMTGSIGSCSGALPPGAEYTTPTDTAGRTKT